MAKQLVISLNEEALELPGARAALDSRDRDAAWQRLFNALNRLSAETGTPAGDSLFVQICLELGDASFVLGKGFGELLFFLQSALLAAERIGDRRSQAMINLHLGRLYYFGEQRPRAMEVFEKGKQMAEEIGDEDMRTAASEFIGLYYFIQGLFPQALTYFEMAAQSFESEKGGLLNPSGPMWLSYCYAFLGRHNHAIGTLDYYRRLAQEQDAPHLAATLRAVLGILLLDIRKNREATFHLSGALQEAKRTKNTMALYFATGGIAYHHIVEGRHQEARDLLARATSEGSPQGLVQQYASPFVLEAVYSLYKKGLPPIARLSWQRELQRLLVEPNIHLRGVALRLQAQDLASKQQDDARVRDILEQSEAYLLRSGDPVQLAKTRLEMVRWKLRNNDEKGARALAKAAWRGLTGLTDVFFPDDLRRLVDIPPETGGSITGHEDVFDLFVEMIRDLAPSADLRQLLLRMVRATNRFFGAERGGLFWFPRKRTDEPFLRAGCNLSEADVGAPEFASSLELVFAAFRENRAQVFRQPENALDPTRAKAMITVPFEVDGRVQGVLYHDNSYVADCFSNLDPPRLTRMAEAVTSYVEHLLDFCRRVERESHPAPPPCLGESEGEILTRSPLMQRVLEQADRVAATDSSVLILGETGVGKELLARRIHRRSGRADRPFVVVDPTAIPESLMESELFGHEKGAFTGADQRRKGRVEQAHQGTLFIDEVGEIPLAVQAKLLRVLQEKAMVRVGGSSTIRSDFRLLAATNRNLEKMVEQGSFRQDLYFRINVIPMTLPPLRERKQDPVLLARHFLERYSSRYGRRLPAISAEDREALTSYAWPGNIRELQNIMERAVLLSFEDSLELDFSMNQHLEKETIFSDNPTLDEVQRRYIKHVLKKTGGRIAGKGGAAELLGMKRTSLYNRMKKLDIK